MRVITGTARGMVLKTLEGENTRPTTEKVKEAIFSALQFEIEGRRILDLFAGSGQMGIEALSRGAKNCVFVDSDKSAAGIIKENIAKVRFQDCSKLIQSDALSFLRMTNDVFDIVFLDPPYSTGLLEKALDKIDMNLSEGGVVVCEHPSDSTLPDEIHSLKKYRTYKYGKISVTVFRKEG